MGGWVGRLGGWGSGGFGWVGRLGGEGNWKDVGGVYWWLVWSGAGMGMSSYRDMYGEWLGCGDYNPRFPS